MGDQQIKVSECFFSLQGEGLYIGTPSLFIRTFGCNCTCSQYAMPRGVDSTERFEVDPAKYTKYEDLPLVSTGCDSYPSWDIRFKHLSPLLTLDEIVARSIALLPNNRFNQNKHLILTGGEPLLGWQKLYPQLFDLFLPHGLTHITFETNGTKKLVPELIEYLDHSPLDITFSISSKLPSSGESWEKAIRPEIVKDYVMYDNAYFKWVISNKEDIEDALRAVDAYAKYKINIPVYLMPAGGTSLHYDENKKWVAELAKQYGFRYSSRLQVDLWKNVWNS